MPIIKSQDHRLTQIRRVFRRSLAQLLLKTVSSELMLFRTYPVSTWKPPRMTIARELWKVCSSAWLASWWNTMKLDSSELFLDNTVSELTWLCLSRGRLSYSSSDLCVSFPACECKNNGQCDEGYSGTGRCFCETGWTGRLCETKLGLCLLSPVCPWSYGLKLLAVQQKVSIDKTERVNKCQEPCKSI